MEKSNTIMSRVIAGVTLGVAFLIMASIITPHGTSASDGQGDLGHDDLTSTDPHHDLPGLGLLESPLYIVSIHRTDVGPRFTVREREGGRIVATLRTAKQIEEEFPEIPLAEMDFSGSSSLMYADPDHTWHD